MSTESAPKFQPNTAASSPPRAIARDPHEDAVFKALADPLRRSLLDSLFERSGQTLRELGALAPGITRFGVMKHLRTLEESGLVATRRVGREKLHYLNPVPIRLIHDRWISKYTRPWATTLSQLKTALEDTSTTFPRHIYEIYVRATPDQLWQAITGSEYIRQYFEGVTAQSSWQPGSRYHMVLPDGTTLFEGTILDIEPPRRLIYSFHYVGDEGASREHPSRVAWEIVPFGESCKLTLVHDEFAAGEVATFREVGESWPFTLSSLKTLLETGEPLRLRPGSPLSNG